jgi:SAM-dependent methyltransferase
MGINLQTAQFLTAIRDQGVSYERTLTLGHQDLYGQGPIRSADGLFQELGARSLDALDASEYEGATIIHDLNEPIPDSLRGRFTAVFDGGTLEHVYNAGTALQNCLEMVAPGGHYIAASPGNNQMGHGFYQFSPEFYYRALSADYGFHVERLLALEQRLLRVRWYEALDPELCHGRVQLRSRYPVELLVLAKRVSPAAEDRSTPQQSLYVAAWEGPDVEAPPWKLRVRTALHPKIVSAVDVAVKQRRTSWSSGGFRRISAPASPSASRS